MKQRVVFGAALAACMVTGAAQAQISEDEAKMFAEEHILPVLNDPEVVSAIKEQNERNATLDAGGVNDLDARWRAGDQTLIEASLSTELSQKLKGIRNDSQGLFTEIFIMDANGLNVAQSDMTSDYWQGDEDKWLLTYQVGPNAIHVSDVEHDESTQTFQVQISVPIADGDAVVGAATFGVNAEML